MNLGAAAVFVLIGIVLGTIAQRLDAAFGREWPKELAGNPTEVAGTAPCGMCGRAELHRASCVLGGR